MQYTRPDLMYAVKCLSRNDSSPSDSAFQCRKDLIWNLSGFPYLPIIYTYGIDGTNTHNLRQEVSPGDFHSKNISNCLVDFADGG